MLLRPGTCYESKGRQCMAIFENFFEVPQLEENFLSLFCDSTKLCTYFYLYLFCSCASRNDMLEACDSRNLDVLQKEFPL